MRARGPAAPGQALRLRLTDEGRIDLEPVNEPLRIEYPGRQRLVVAPDGAPPLAEHEVGEVRRELREWPRGA